MITTFEITSGERIISNKGNQILLQIYPIKKDSFSTNWQVANEASVLRSNGISKQGITYINSGELGKEMQTRKPQIESIYCIYCAKRVKSNTSQCQPPSPTAFLTTPCRPSKTLFVLLFPVTTTLVCLGRTDNSSSPLSSRKGDKTREEHSSVPIILLA